MWGATGDGRFCLGTKEGGGEQRGWNDLTYDPVQRSSAMHRTMADRQILTVRGVPRVAPLFGPDSGYYPMPGDFPSIRHGKKYHK